jgi:hypothetical protein
MCKAINVYAHHDDMRNFTQLAISVPDRCKGLTSDRTHNQRTNAYKSVRGSSLTSLTIILFTRVAPRIKNKELSIDGPFSVKTYDFYPRIKSKGLPIDDLLLSKNVCFLHV